MSKLLRLNDVYTVSCNWKDTRNGFKHEAKILKNGYIDYETKICYLNRTWERFEYESILLKIINDYFEGQDKESFLNIVRGLIHI